MFKIVSLRTPATLIACALLVTIFHTKLNAQAGDQNWYFGIYAGLSFSTSPPTVLNNGATTQVNATACMSDDQGNLLFYTDGGRVWNRHHQIMANGSGLDGDYGNYAQHVVIVHHPGNSNLYYIFYSSNHNYPVHIHRLKYSIVDMSDGNGVVQSKNTMLPTDDILQKIAAVEKRGAVFWIVTQGDKTGKYFCFRGTAAGIETTPVVTDSGVPTQSSYDYGELRFSPDGKILAATSYSGSILLFKFDFGTGALNNRLLLPATSPTAVEFSPDGKLLYVTSHANCSVNTLYQYNITSYTQSQITASRISLGSAQNIGMLRRGPDNRIYVGRRATNCNSYAYIGTIDQPNVPGTGASFNAQSIFLQAGSTFQGLPNFATTLCGEDLIAIPEKVVACSQEAYTFNLSGIPYSLRWENGSTDAVRVVTQPGKYWVEVTLGTCKDRDTIQVIFENATIQFEKDTAYLFSRPVTLAPSGNTPDKIVWQDNSTAAAYTAAEPGQYSFAATVNGCTFHDTIIVIRRDLFVPNVITVNADNRNDFFVLPFIRPSEHWQVRIYDRYGTEIFSDSNYKNNWQSDRNQVCYYRIVNTELGIDVRGPLHVLN